MIIFKLLMRNVFYQVQIYKKVIIDRATWFPQVTIIILLTTPHSFQLNSLCLTSIGLSFFCETSMFRVNKGHITRIQIIRL